jgi:hypothetical protein
MITINESGFDDNGTLYGFTASGGVPPYTFSVVSGAMPAGLKLNPDGTVVGISTGGSYNVTLRATDSKIIPESGDRTYNGTLTGTHVIPIIKP